MTTLAVTLEGQELLARSLGTGKAGGTLTLRLDDHPGLLDRAHILSLTGAGDFWEAARRFLTDPAFAGEQPCRLFEPRHYARQAAPFPGLHPLLHYLLVGDAAGLDPHPVVAGAFIRGRYAVPEGATALDFLLRHPATVAPNPYFDPVWYLSVNNDVFRNGATPLLHYLDFGIAERRNFHPLFHVGWYQAVSGTENVSMAAFLERRAADGLFPHPRARAGWAGLPDGALGALFARHLTPTPLDRFPAPSPDGDTDLDLVPEVFADEQRSIQEAFPHRRAQALERALLDHYRRDPALARTLVSVVIPTRNRLATLRAAVASVQEQSHAALEIIVVDDGGSDGTGAWIESLGDPRIRYAACPARGVSAARNHGLDMARGDYVTFLDSDNTHLPTFVAAMLAWCAREGATLAYGALRLWNSGGDVRYRFRDYDEADYWKTNYIDLNVLFHARAPFRAVRFDETLRRCVDWDYILKLAALTPPAGVPVIGCDYAHESRERDRITLNGPVWDCFRVSRAARPASPRRGRAGDVLVLPVTPATALARVRLLARDLADLPAGWVVQAAFAIDVAPEARRALRALLVSRGHPEPLLAISPLCAGALAEFAAAGCPVAADRWHFAHPTATPPLAALVRLAAGSPAVTAVTVAEPGEAGAGSTAETGTVAAMRHDRDRGRWEQAEVAPDLLGRDCVPLRASLVNVPAFAPEGMELRFTGSLTLPLLLRSLWLLDSGRPRVIVTPPGGFQDDGPPPLDAAEIAAGLALLDAARAAPPAEDGTGDDFGAITATRHAAGAVRLGAIHRRRRLAGRRPLAVFTPAPGPGSGWGDEHYARALAAAMRAERIDCDVVYRGDWAARRDAYEAIVHLRGIIPVVPSWTAHNFLWIISHPEAVSDREYAGCESIAVASRPFAAQLATVLARRVHHLPQCTAFTPPDGAGGRGAALPGPLGDYALFVGDSKKVNRPPVNDLLDSWPRLFLIGPRWGEIPAMGPRYLPHSIDNRVLPQLYASFGAVLNQHWESMARLGFVSNRIYDVLASGGQLVTDACAGLPDDVRARAVVWQGGPMEDAFLEARGRAGPDTIERAHAFAADNSFVRRARSLLAFWAEDVPELLL